MTLSAAGIVPYLAVSFAVYDELKAMLPGSKAARLEWWYPVAKIGIGAAAAVTAQARPRWLAARWPAALVRASKQGWETLCACAVWVVRLQPPRAVCLQPLPCRHVPGLRRCPSSARRR